MTVVEGTRSLAEKGPVMFKKLLLATAISGSVFATGPSVSATDHVQVEPAPTSPGTTPVGDFAGTAPRVAPTYHVNTCHTYRICDGLKRFCANEGGYYSEQDSNGTIVGICVTF